MNPEPRGAQRTWDTVRLLLRATRVRAVKRALRQRQIMHQKKGTSSDPLSELALIFLFMMHVFVHGIFGFAVHRAGQMAGRLEVESKGKLSVSSYSLTRLREWEGAKKQMAQTERKISEEQHKTPSGNSAELTRVKHELSRLQKSVKTDEEWFFRFAARDRKSYLGGKEEEHETALRKHYAMWGPDGFAADGKTRFNLSERDYASPLVLAAANVVFLWWFVMLTFQGEGLELDFQKRRHPMWEWLFTHPIRPEAAFLAEMVSPLAANPAYLAAPVFWIVSLSFAHDIVSSIVAGILIGLPFAVACGCCSKALEMTAMLRLSSRTRGAVLGIMSWFGYSSFVIALIMLGSPAMLRMVVSALRPIADVAGLPLAPSLLAVDGSIAQAVLFSWLVCAVLIAASLWLSALATRNGLESGFDGGPSTPKILDVESQSRFSRDPLRRKELLWFWRDRGAIVQAVLIPLTIGATQAFNFRNLAAAAGTAWNYLAGLAVICGTYFLLVLGPRSLVSEGPALWITLTWPRGLENLLKEKARLWWWFSNAAVGLVLAFAIARFPTDWWKVALVGAGWWFFGRSLAEKSVTLVAAPTSSGEPEPVPKSRQWSAMLGTFAFGTGVMTQNWHLAILGVVFSALTSAAMWQNFRARLPFLFDPWSEKMPQPPTLMHSMIAVAVMSEAIALVSIPILLFVGIENAWTARTIAYAVVALVTFIIMDSWLSGHGVPTKHIIRWEERAHRSGPIPMLCSYGGATVIAVALGLAAVGYTWVLTLVPQWAEPLAQQAELMRSHPGQKLWLAISAIGVAPFAEEYLFRGLLYRALDREWSGWKALIGNAAFFAIYHPPISWPLVFAVGLINGVIFKRTGSLWPCVVLHAVYNAIVVMSE